MQQLLLKKIKEDPTACGNCLLPYFWNFSPILRICFDIYIYICINIYIYIFYIYMCMYKRKHSQKSEKIFENMAIDNFHRQFNFFFKQQLLRLARIYHVIYVWTLYIFMCVNVYIYLMYWDRTHLVKILSLSRKHICDSFQTEWNMIVMTVFLQILNQIELHLVKKIKRNQKITRNIFLSIWSESKRDFSFV